VSTESHRAPTTTLLSSERLRIEPLRIEHTEQVMSDLQDPAIYRYLPGDPPSPQALHRRHAAWVVGHSPDGGELWLNWVAFLGDTMLPIGTAQATLPRQGPGMFAYTIFPPYWRQGYAKEMTRSVLDHLFKTHKSTELRAEIDTRNIGSIRVVESLGLARVALTRDADFFKGTSSDEFTYAISRDDWLAQN